MKIFVTVTLISLIYSLLVTIVYFSKKRLKTIENKIYDNLLKINIVGLILELFCYFFIAYSDLSDFMEIMKVIVNKTFLIYLLTWIILFTTYVFFISLYETSYYKKKMKEEKKKIFYIIFAAYIVLSTIIIALPLNYNNGEYIYSYGTSTNFLLSIGVISIIFDIVCVVKNIKNIRKNKKYYPIFVLILLMIFAALMRSLNPGYTVINSCFAFITILMYFTIENPDLQVIDELLRNKELVEQTVNDKSNFLFKVSEEIKKPIQSIIDDIKIYNDKFTKAQMKELLISIKTKANNAYFIVNDITSISSMDVKKLSIQENKYKTEKLFKEVEYTAKNRLALLEKQDTIKLSFKTTTSYPEYLYGDHIKLKQILLSILSNSITYTTSGFIDIEIDTITRYDVARLIFTIKDSGCGMSISKINQLLSSKDEIDPKIIDKTDNLNLNIPTIIKIIKILGGSINIKSEKGKGTIVTIVINQKIALDEKEKILMATKKYNNTMKKKPKVLLIEDLNVTETLAKKLSRYEVDTISTSIGKDAIDRTKSGDNFDLIIIKDELKPDSAYTILQELKKIKRFKTPVVIVIEKDKEFIKDHFIEDGFADCILKENLENEIDDIIKKYI